MGYSNFKRLEQVTKRFGLSAKFKARFDDKFTLVQPSDWLVETLETAKLFPLRNEKVKSERIVSPILVEVAKAFKDNVTLFSGEELIVSPEEDLSGACDFFFILEPYQPYIESPIASLVEAKDEDMDYGIAQCAAQLYAAKLFNEREGKDIPILYGCASTGVEWQFLSFENGVFYLDNKSYTDVKEILGVWHYILQTFV